VALAAGVVALALVASSSGPSAGAAGQSAREQRQEVRARQAEVASRVNALQGDQQQVASALAALDENVRGQQAALADAQHQVEVSTAEAARAEAAMAAAAADITALRAKVVAFAVDAYITPPDEDLMRRLEADTAQEDATKRALLEMHSGTQADALDQMRTAQQRLDDERQRAEDAKNQAQESAAAANAAIASLADARTQQQAFADQVRSRLDDQLADAAYLSRVDADLGRRIAAEQAALVAAVKKVPAGGGGGSQSGGSRVASVKRPPLVTVGGITVATSIGDQLRALLAAARADGIVLTGYGWRDSSNQVALRGQNCGWSDFQLYDMPPDQCSPPTARPGSSLHEQGLAVDFRSGGDFLESHSSPAFVWLAANAGRFGFANLPSEPWHWSTTGG